MLALADRERRGGRGGASGLRGRGQVRRHPRARAQVRRRGSRSSRGPSTTSRRSFPEIALALGAARRDRSCSTARSSPGARGAAGRLLLQAPAPPRPQGARRRSCSRRSPRRSSPTTASRSATTPLFETPWSERRARARAAGRRRRVRPLGGVRTPRTPRGARVALRRRARPRQRGPDAEARGLPLPGGKARARVAQVEEGARDARRRRHRGRAGQREARGDALGLHVRGARTATGSSTSARRTRA